MKKNIFCCFLLLALLAGCGQKEPENAIFEMEDDKGTEAAAEEEEEEDAASGKTEDGLVAVADIHGMKLPYLATAKDMDCFHLDQGWLYMGKIAWNPDEERIEMRISRNDIRAGYEPQEYVVLPEAYNLLAFATDGEGNCYVYGQYAANEEAGLFSLEKYDEGGAIVWRRDYTDGELGGMGMQLSEATAVSDGRVFLYTCGTGGSVACFGQEGNLEGITVPEIENLEGLAATGDGQVFAYGTPFGQLEKQLLKGEGPDLMELGNVDALNLAGKGVLEDLTEYYERSNKVDWQDFLPKIQESSVLNGRNALVIPFFYIRT